MLAVAIGLRGASLVLYWALPLDVGLLPLGSLRPPKANSVACDWLALALLFVAYWEVDWVQLPRQQGLLVQQWVVWNKLLLNHRGQPCGDRALRLGGFSNPRIR